MYRNVTELLAVDASNPACITIDDAVSLIRVGDRTIVGDDATAVAVLERIGLTRARAIDQVRVSYGPMRDPMDECLKHLSSLMPTGWLQKRGADDTIEQTARWFRPHSKRVGETPSRDG